MTAGALVSNLDSGSSTGFVVKVSPDARLIAGTYLGSSYVFAGAIAVNPQGELIVAGAGQGSTPGFLERLDSSLSRVTASTPIPGAQAMPASALALDANGDVFVLGQADTGDVFVTKVAATSWTVLSSTAISAPNGVRTGSMVLDGSGVPVVALATGAGAYLINPFLAGPMCGANSSLIAKLNADDLGIDFSTYLDGCGPPPIALGPNGAVYAGVSPQAIAVPAAVLKVRTNRHPQISLGQIWNAFSGDSSAVVPGGLYSIAVPGLPLPLTDFGLNSSIGLPFELAGVRVLFDGVEASIFRIEAGRVIVAAPLNLTAPVTRMRVHMNDLSSDEGLMPVAASLPGLLTVNFPAFPPNMPDGNVRNQDGSLNDADHPAALGSTITAFVTGMGVANVPYSPGSVATSDAVIPKVTYYPNYPWGSSDYCPACLR